MKHKKSVPGCCSLVEPDQSNKVIFDSECKIKLITVIYLLTSLCFVISCLNFTLSPILGANSFISISVNCMQHSPVTSLITKLSITLSEISLSSIKSASSLHDNPSITSCCVSAKFCQLSSQSLYRPSMPVITETVLATMSAGSAIDSQKSNLFSQKSTRGLRVFFNGGRAIGSQKSNSNLFSQKSTRGFRFF